MHRDERLPVGGHEVDLFGELTLRRFESRLALNVEQARRQLPVAVLNRVAVLLDAQDAIIVVNRQHGDSARVFHEFAREFALAVGEALATDVPDHAGEGNVAREHLDAVRLITQRRTDIALE